MPKPIKANLPIGYWLKQADNLITEQVNQAQAAHGVSRFGWQVLNTLYEAGPMSRERLFELMRTFVDSAGLDEIITRLIERGWVEQNENSAGEFQLTQEGQRCYGDIFAAQKEVRLRAMQGVSEEEYATVIRVLQRIVNNLKEKSSI
jgi:DNA-binding MarR family transcriptional regulator